MLPHEPPLVNPKLGRFVSFMRYPINPPPVLDDDTKHRSESGLVVPLRFSVFSFATVVRLQGLDRRVMGPNVQPERMTSVPVAS